ncbi:serologically defined colon cancer antigen 8 isoform X3 [Monodelphis domestica]|uniref:serologically defined colon cancer antigen 8 isoform X3 n=1 Tax=Monodelphis domestica TaxID=13616 RepID=UPI0024E23B59|nr:serologically defined colon cancer antigen 8 isoform X3 [Monodelphis domestica]
MPGSSLEAENRLFVTVTDYNFHYPSWGSVGGQRPREPERANRSIHQLKCALQESDIIVGEDEFEQEESYRESVTEESGSTWQELHHSHAVTQLKALLNQQNSKENEISQPRRRKILPSKTSEDENSSFPAVFDLVPIINDQSQYIHHLEAEVKFCKEELSGMKQRIQMVVLENEKLQEDLKSRQSEQRVEQIIMDSSVGDRSTRKWENNHEARGCEMTSPEPEPAGWTSYRFRGTESLSPDFAQAEPRSGPEPQKKDFLSPGPRPGVGSLTLDPTRSPAHALFAGNHLIKHHPLPPWDEAHELALNGNPQNSWVTPVDFRKCQDSKLIVTPNALDQVKSTTSDLEKWQLELERLKLIYEEKNEVLESQVNSLRKDLCESQKNCEELKGRLRHLESLNSTSNRIGGLCLKCSQHEAVLTQTHTSTHIQTIERLTKERDDLMSALVGLRKTLSEMQQMESSAYEQVKQAVLMTEEANFEKTKSLIQCEQLKTELERQKSRFEKELEVQQEKRFSEKETLRQEMKKEREDLGATMIALSQNMAQLETQMEKVTREKLSIASQLEAAQKQLASHDVDLTEVCGEMRYQLNQTKMKKDEAEKEHREYRTKTLRELEFKDQEIEKLKLELNESKQRMEQAQQDGARARDECIKLTELLGQTEHQLHLTRLEKGSIQQSFSNNAKAQALQAQQREQELTQKMQQMEAQHDKAENERYSLLSSQNAFMAKLKEECCMLAEKLEEITDKSRCEVSKLNQENKYMTDRLEKLQNRNKELEDQCVQHGKMHERMKLRLNQLDRHCETTAQQLVLLLKKQNELFKERQNLAEEVQSLKSQVLSQKPRSLREENLQNARAKEEAKVAHAWGRGSSSPPPGQAPSLLPMFSPGPVPTAASKPKLRAKPPGILRCHPGPSKAAGTPRDI